MFTTRRSKLFAGAIIIVLAFVVLLALSPAIGANLGIWSRVGMGDVHRVEVQNPDQNPDALPNSKPYVGMGDVHRLEASQADIQTQKTMFSDHSYIGMGDLHYYEYLQSTAEKEETSP